MDIDVPVVNIGTFGKDGHKFTERVHMKYTFENVTNMTLNTIMSLLG
jgi:arginine utilization protein RocB